jgi:hypothetical protein
MGGTFSTRWNAHLKRPTVEQGLTLDLGQLARKGCFKSWYSGRVGWSEGGNETASLGFHVLPEGGGLVLWLSYRVVGRQQDVEVRVPLETTRPHFGGVRWWFVCPLAVNGRACGRRAGKLYLPPGARYFGCRRCYGLTYTSCQESHKFDSVYRLLARDTGFDFAAVKRAINRIGKRR